MRRIFTIALFFSVTACSTSIVQDSLVANNVSFNEAPEKQLSYLVNFKGEEYVFLLETQRVFPDLVFTYLMSNHKETRGKITVKETALINAKELWNYFGNEEVVLEKQSSVWLSNYMFNQIKKTDSLRIKINIINYDNFYLTEEGTTKLNINGQKRVFNYFRIKSDRGYYLKVIDDVDSPIILEMDMGWTIKFKEAFY